MHKRDELGESSSDPIARLDPHNWRCKHMGSNRAPKVFFFCQPLTPLVVPDTAAPHNTSSELCIADQPFGMQDVVFSTERCHDTKERQRNMQRMQGVVCQGESLSGVGEGASWSTIKTRAVALSSCSLSIDQHTRFYTHINNEVLRRSPRLCCRPCLRQEVHSCRHPIWLRHPELPHRLRW